MNTWNGRKVADILTFINEDKLPPAITQRERKVRNNNPRRFGTMNEW